MNLKIFFLVVLLFTIPVAAQSTRVVKVLDSNLFELEDGRFVKLAGIDSPNLSHPSPFFQAAARDAVEYSNMNLLDRIVETETLSKLPGKNFEIVMMYKKYFLSKVNVSTRYLLYGYGKFFDNVNVKSKEEFLDFQQSAIDEKRGMWLYDSLSVSNTLDTDLVQGSENNSLKIDPRLEYKVKRPIPIYQAIPSELLAGGGITFVSTLGLGLIGAAIFWHPLGGVVVAYYGFILTYGIGFPSGVYLVAKIANPDLSYWATIGFSIGFTAVTAGLSYGMFPNDHHHPTRTIAYLSPIIGSLLYTNLIAPNPSTKQNAGRNNIGTYNIKPNFSHKDFYNSTMLLNMDLIRINF